MIYGLGTAPNRTGEGWGNHLVLKSPLTVLFWHIFGHDVLRFLLLQMYSEMLFTTAVKSAYLSYYILPGS